MFITLATNKNSFKILKKCYEKARKKKNVPAPCHPFFTVLSSLKLQCFFFPLERDFATKRNPKFEKEPILEVFETPEVRNCKCKNWYFEVRGFHCVAKNIDRWLKICALFLVLFV
jgi:hypothetical protein